MCLFLYATTRVQVTDNRRRTMLVFLEAACQMSMHLSQSILD